MFNAEAVFRALTVICLRQKNSFNIRRNLAITRLQLFFTQHPAFSPDFSAPLPEPDGFVPPAPPPLISSAFWHTVHSDTSVGGKGNWHDEGLTCPSGDTEGRYHGDCCCFVNLLLCWK